MNVPDPPLGCRTWDEFKQWRQSSKVKSLTDAKGQPVTYSHKTGTGTGKRSVLHRMWTKASALARAFVRMSGPHGVGVYPTIEAITGAKRFKV